MGYFPTNNLNVSGLLRFIFPFLLINSISFITFIFSQNCHRIHGIEDPERRNKISWPKGRMHIFKSMNK